MGLRSEEGPAGGGSDSPRTRHDSERDGTARCSVADRSQWPCAWSPGPVRQQLAGRRLRPPVPGRRVPLLERPVPAQHEVCRVILGVLSLLSRWYRARALNSCSLTPDTLMPACAVVPQRQRAILGPVAGLSSAGRAPPVPRPPVPLSLVPLLQICPSTPFTIRTDE